MPIFFSRPGFAFAGSPASSGVSPCARASPALATSSVAAVVSAAATLRRRFTLASLSALLTARGALVHLFLHNPCRWRGRRWFRGRRLRNRDCAPSRGFAIRCRVSPGQRIIDGARRANRQSTLHDQLLGFFDGDVRDARPFVHPAVAIDLLAFFLAELLEIAPLIGQELRRLGLDAARRSDWRHLRIASGGL